MSLVENNRQGRIGEAIARYERHGKILGGTTAVESYKAMVDGWYEEWKVAP